MSRQIVSVVARWPQSNKRINTDSTPCEVSSACGREGRAAGYTQHVRLTGSPSLPRRGRAASRRASPQQTRSSWRLFSTDAVGLDRGLRTPRDRGSPRRGATVRSERVREFPGGDGGFVDSVRSGPTVCANAKGRPGARAGWSGRPCRSVLVGSAGARRRGTKSPLHSSRRMPGGGGRPAGFHLLADAVRVAPVAASWPVAAIEQAYRADNVCWRQK